MVLTVPGKALPWLSVLASFGLGSGRGNQRGSVCTPFLGSSILLFQIILSSKFSCTSSPTSSWSLRHSWLQGGRPVAGWIGKVPAGLSICGFSKACQGSDRGIGERSVSAQSGQCPASQASLSAVGLGGGHRVTQTPPSHLAGRTQRHAGHSHLSSVADRGQLVT